MLYVSLKTRFAKLKKSGCFVKPMTIGLSKCAIKLARKILI